MGFNSAFKGLTPVYVICHCVYSMYNFLDDSPHCHSSPVKYDLQTVATLATFFI